MGSEEQGKKSNRSTRTLDRKRGSDRDREEEGAAAKVKNMIQTCTILLSTWPLPIDGQMRHTSSHLLTFDDQPVAIFHGAGNFGGRQRGGGTLGPLQRGTDVDREQEWEDENRSS